MTPFRPEPKPEDIEDPELRKIVLYLKFKSEQRSQKYLEDLQRPMKQLEARRAAYERERQAPAMKQRHELALKMFR